MSDIALRAPFAGWFGTLDEVADAVFADRMIGDGAAIDPTEGVLRAPADAEVISVPDSAHAVTLRLANDVELLLHVGLDTVALGGEGFDAQVAAGDCVAAGDPLIRFDLEAVARRARDLVTPIVLPGEGACITLDRPGRMVASGEVIAHVSSGATALTAERDGAEAITREILVAAPLGLHARPAARIVALLKRFDAVVTLERGERTAGGASTVALLALGAKAGERLVAHAHGADAAAALNALAAFAAERFGDAVDAVPAAEVRVPSGGGVCAAPGFAVGTIVQFRLAAVAVPARGESVAAERAALAAAHATVAATLDDAAGGDGVVAAHRALLDDPVLLADAAAALAGGASAGGAWQRAIAAAATALTTTGDVRVAERVADLRDIERQVLVALYGAGETATDLPPDAIVVADDLLPSQFLALDRARLAGIITARGGPTAHVAILVAAACIPMVVAAGADVLAQRDGAPAILDAGAARLEVDPADARLAEARDIVAAQRATDAAARAAAQAPATTADGVRIEVFANLSSLEDAASAVAAGAEGCGLLRTEFLFLDRDTAPDEAEQRAQYAAIAAALGDRPLIVRTLDIGADKPVRYLPLPAEENPALGARGIRLSLARPELLATQLRAIVAAVPAGQCRIMLPMVADVRELIAARAALNAIAGAENVALGVMIETPAAALIADRLAAHADFLSVGTNDLTQYALAADRGNAAVAALVDPLHPAVLRLIALAAEGAAKHGRWLGVCGGLASDPGAVTLLIGLGVTELSAVPAAVPAVKAAVRRTTLAAARELAQAALAAEDAAAVRALIEGRA